MEASAIWSETFWD